MRRKIRRMIGLVLAVMLCMALLPTTAFATTYINNDVTVTEDIYTLTEDMVVNKGATLTFASSSNQFYIDVCTLTNYGTIDGFYVVLAAQEGVFYNYGIYQFSDAQGTIYDLTLSSIALSSGTLSPSFAAGTREYAVTVDNSVTSIDITPTLNTGTGVKSMTVNGVTATSGAASTVSLSVGENSIPIVITANDGIDTTNTYTLTVTRASAATHTHSLTHVEVRGATCTSDGNSEYWYCTECGKYFSDSAATAEISQSDTVISAKGHSLTHVEAQAETCTADGNKEYWYCTECGKYFSDSAATAEISQSDTVIAAKGHSLTHIEAKDATCTANGNKEYWYCSECGKYFSDSSATTEISLSDTVISAKGHSLTHVEAKDATCTSDGNKEYWYCSECGKYFSDSAATAEISQSDTVISAKGHSLTHMEAKDATCTANGNSEYWYCTECGKYFSDSAATTEINLSDTVLALTSHSYGSWYSDKQNHWHVCAQCGEIADQEAHSFGAWTVTKEPTATATGLKTRTCTVCGYTQTRRIAATGSDNPKTGGPALSLLLPAAALGGLALLTGKRRGRGKFPKNQD